MEMNRNGFVYWLFMWVFSVFWMFGDVLLEWRWMNGMFWWKKLEERNAIYGMIMKWGDRNNCERGTIFTMNCMIVSFLIFQVEIERMNKHPLDKRLTWLLNKPIWISFGSISFLLALATLSKLHLTITSQTDFNKFQFFFFLNDKLFIRAQNKSFQYFLN